MTSEPTLHQLRVFDVLLAERSLTRAATVLGTSQPALTKVLNQLRAQFGDPLFVRAGRGVAPTVAALDLRERVRDVLAAAARLGPKPEPFDPATSGRSFGVFISDVGALRLAEPLMQRLETEAPRLRVRLLSLDRRQLIARLEGGDVDLAVGAFAELPAGMRRRALRSEGYEAVVRRRHPFTRTRPDLGAFRRARHVLVTARDSGHAHGAAEAVLERTLAQDRILLRVPGFMAAAMAVRHTDMVAVMPSNLSRYVAAEFDLAVVPVPLALPKVEVVLVWHERAQRDPGHRWLRRLLSEILRRPYGADAGPVISTGRARTA